MAVSTFSSKDSQTFRNKLNFLFHWLLFFCGFTWFVWLFCVICYVASASLSSLVGCWAFCFSIFNLLMFVPLTR